MNNKARTIGIILIWIWLLRPPLFFLLGLSFATEEHLVSYKEIWYIFLPVAIALIVMQTKNGKTKIQKGVAIMIFSITTVMMLFLINSTWGFLSVCQTKHTATPLRNPSKTEVITYSYVDCGAWDTDYPHPKLKKIHILNSWLIQTTLIKENEIDSTQWIKMK